jgi:hypothetical protein
MSATGSFDHRAIDGADGAALMKAFKELCEKPRGWWLYSSASSVRKHSTHCPVADGVGHRACLSTH